MIINKALLENFTKFVKEGLGIEVLYPPFLRADEIARFMYGDDICVIRPMGSEPSYENVEVWCSNSQKLDALDNAWMGQIMSDADKQSEQAVSEVAAMYPDIAVTTARATKVPAHMLRNPVTGEIFQKEENYVQSLIDTYLEASQERIRQQATETQIVAAFNELAHAKFGKALRGSYQIDGRSNRVDITIRHNVTYKRNRGEDHPLRVLLKEFDKALGDLIKIDYEESGSKIEKLIERVKSGNVGPDDDPELVRRLLEVRVEKEGKPSIKIEDIVEIPSVEGSDGVTASSVF